MSRMIVRSKKDDTRWNAVNEHGRVIGYVYKDGLNGPYLCVVDGEKVEHPDRADALLSLAVRTDEKERA